MMKRRWRQSTLNICFILLGTALYFTWQVADSSAINDPDGKNERFEAVKSNLQATVRNLQSGFQRSFSYPSKETDDALGDMRSQIEKITRAHPAGVRISLQRTNSFDGTPVIVQKVVSTRPSQSGNARNGNSNGQPETMYDLLDDVKNPYVPPETRKILVTPGTISIQQLPDGGYIANGYRIPADFQLDAAKLAEFIKQVVDKHNQLRARHDSPPLRLDPKLSRYSQWWANELLQTNSFHHSPKEKRPQIGENIYWAGVPYMPGNFPVEIWYEEGKNVNYNYNTNDPTPKAGHFTQVLWRNSNRIGVGIASDPKKGMYVVCNYSPAGNYEKQFRANVLAPTGKK